MFYYAIIAVKYATNKHTHTHIYMHPLKNKKSKKRNKTKNIRDVTLLCCVVNIKIGL